MNCPSCGDDRTKILESQQRQAGWYYRRHLCHCCQYRWSTRREGGKITPIKRRPNTPGFRTLAPDAVRRILRSDEPIRHIAAAFGVQHGTIHRIKTGKTYREIYLELHPEKTDEGCVKCRYWDKRCSFGFPEAGGRFAFDCSLFEQ